VARLPKTSQLEAKTRLLSFDLEANGLHGNAFAVGAVVMDAKGKIYSEFVGRCRLNGKTDPWVEANVLPAISDMPVSYRSYKALREAFWAWYLEAEPQADYVLVSNGYPVEYRFLMQCQEDDLEARYWQHPFPILDLSSLLLGLGLNSSQRTRLFNDIIHDEKFSRHQPLHDAKATALTAFKALSLSD
jgi:hypothetical protein